MNYLEKIIRGGVYLTLLLPLIFTSRTMYPWHFGKTLLFQMVVDVLVFLGVLYLYKKRERPIRFHMLDWAVFAFFAAQIIATLFGVDPVRSFWGYQSRAQGVVVWMHLVLFYLLIRQFFYTKQHTRTLMVGVFVVGVISAFLGWVGPHLSLFEGKIPFDARLSGLIGNPLFFAAYLIFPATFGFVLFVQSKKAFVWRWVFLAGAVFCTVTALFSQARGVFLGMVAGVLVVLVLLYATVSSKKMRTWVAGVLAVLVLLGGGTYALFQSNEDIRQSVPVVGRLLDIRLDTGTVTTRLMAWEIALTGWRERPVFGFGPENFQYVFDRHYNPNFLRFSFAETVWDKPHNFFLEVLVTAGVIGFAAFLFVLWSVFFALKRLLGQAKTREERLGHIVLVGGLVAFLVQSLFGIETTNTLHLWYLALGIVGSRYAADALRPAGKRAGSVHVALVVFIALGAGYLLTQHVRFYNASVLMGDTRDAAEIGYAEKWKTNAVKTLDYSVPFLPEQAKYITQDMSNLDSKDVLTKAMIEPVSERVVRVFEDAIARVPGSYQYHYWLGEMYAMMGEYLDEMYLDTSNEHLERAGEISPGQQRIPLVLSKNYLLQGREEESLQMLEELVRKDPTLNEPRWFLGLALVRAGEEDRGIAELEASQSFGLQFRANTQYLIDLYAKREEYDKILPLYERLISQYSDDASLYASLAATHAALGNTDEVIRYMNIAVQLNPALKQEAIRFLEQQGIAVPGVSQ